MPRKSVAATMKQYAHQLEGATETLAVRDSRNSKNHPAPLFRREQAIRKACEVCGDPLIGLAHLAVNASDPEFKAAVYRAMLPYVHAQQKAVELSGPGGEQLVIEVRKVGAQETP